MLVLVHHCTSIEEFQWCCRLYSASGRTFHETWIASASFSETLWNFHRHDCSIVQIVFFLILQTTYRKLLKTIKCKSESTSIKHINFKLCHRILDFHKSSISSYSLVAPCTSCSSSTRHPHTMAVIWYALNSNTQHNLCRTPQRLTCVLLHEWVKVKTGDTKAYNSFSPKVPLDGLAFSLVTQQDKQLYIASFLPANFRGPGWHKFCTSTKIRPCPCPPWGPTESLLWKKRQLDAHLSWSRVPTV